MINLILDFGNTRYKLALFEQDDLIYQSSGIELNISDLLKLKLDYPTLKSTIFSSVIELKPELKSFLLNDFQAIELNHLTPIPIQNQYQTPATLGKDRLAAAVAAAMLYPNTNVLIIDAGSSITYDLITEKGNYIGGGISLGIQMRFKALHHFTGKLPLISQTYEQVELVGKNTEESIRSGVLNGLLHEVDGVIHAYKSIHNDILVLITGGDLKYFDKNLKNNIFAAENLVLQGLNFILKYNDNKKA